MLMCVYMVGHIDDSQTVFTVCRDYCLEQLFSTLSTQFSHFLKIFYKALILS